MGIMHKLFKRRDFEYEGFIMDLTKSKDSSQTNDSNDPSEDDLLPKLATEDNQFTAEHIVQLCKFLAEKSKRNKSICKRLPNSPNQNDNKLKCQTQYQRESKLNEEYVEQDVNQIRCSSRLHEKDVVKHETHSHILAHKFKIDSNSNEEFNQKNFITSNKRCNSKDKRDILLKIRHQIFERKRLRQRQLLDQQMDVWRPW